ncbi:hypothetical protein PMAC_001238 [Pneumocystis sp. 'macacae']|nr:hypothetical protein PMAC_001238 [Pneumocystis sp. 'macacae']
MFSNELIFRLQQLTVLQLRTLAIKCGILNNGSKDELITRILKETSKTRLINEHYTSHRILSIDVGIRNLALCSMIVPSTIPKDFDSIDHKNIIINEWDKLSVEVENIECNKGIKKMYKPVDYSFLAYKVAKSFLEKFKPRTILIERQRYRTLNTNTIHEWIIRVNMFEHMLHAVFRCFKEEKIWNDPEADILSIDPTRITSLWTKKNIILKEQTFIGHNLPKNIFMNSVRENLIYLKPSTLRSKKIKTKIVDSLLRINSIFNFENTQITIKDFISQKKDKNILKIDDLADCFLQGVSWVIWEQNKWKLKEELYNNKPLDDFVSD